ncbi:3-deoxy-manno-octulosonate cytidylyltransferase [Sphingomonas sp. 28-62-11]|uniref:3-deoxy-manno-octulosonate cytidylyltransferase n=1 Tax=Sphingomonas sp. 28-62-11 TaxID=1970432 RepID=UPI000BC69522|nr:MAG: 3-deoxy-manno-octulosonate cytidylyltransferase [Sphingomonas sp. 28-62-11]
MIDKGSGGPARVAIIIPSRYASTRYPAKPLAFLHGPDGVSKPLIEWTIDAARAVPGGANVYVATDHSAIAAAAEAAGASVLMTPESCANGTERCAAALDELTDIPDIVVNFQGDALLTPPFVIESLIAAMVADPSIDVATPVIRASPAVQRRLIDDQRAGRVGGTTVTFGHSRDALYFSKSVIPHLPPARIGDPALPLFFHIGVYAYRVPALRAYADLPVGTLELLEGLEQLRFLEAGKPVRIVDVRDPGHDLWELNNPEDIPFIEAILAQRGK